MSTIPRAFITRLKELSKGSFQLQKCKMSLMLVVSHIKQMKNKKAMEASRMKEEVAHFLRKSQDEMAFIQVEHLIKEEEFMTVCDLICLYCHFIVARLQIMKMQKNCPLDLKEAISGIIFASQRCDIPGLSDLRHHFLLKYGQEFLTSAIELRPSSGVNPLIVKKLSPNTPDTETKIRVLNSIASDHGINWEPQSSYNDPYEVPNMQICNELVVRIPNPYESSKTPSPTAQHCDKDGRDGQNINDDHKAQNGNDDGAMASSDKEENEKKTTTTSTTTTTTTTTVNDHKLITSPKQEKSEIKHVHHKLPNADYIYSYFKSLRDNVHHQIGNS